VDGEPLQLKIDERRRQFDHVPTDTEIADKKAGRYVWAPRFDFEPSGELRLHLFDADSRLERKTWKDTKSHPLETQGSKILHGQHIDFLAWAEHYVAGCFDSIKTDWDSGHGRPSEINENATS